MKNLWTNKEIKFLKENYATMINREIGIHLNRSAKAVKAKGLKLKLLKKKVWTDQKIQRLKNIYSNVKNEIIAKEFGTSKATISKKASRLKLRKSKAFMDSVRNKVSCFKPGHVPANKGKKVSVAQREIMKRNFFKKGCVPANTRALLSERINTEGFIEIKIKNDRYGWMKKHRWLYQIHHNIKLSSNDVIIFKDGNQKNCTIDNLVKIDKETIMLQNSRLKLPKEIIPTMTLISKLNKAVNDEK